MSDARSDRLEAALENAATASVARRVEATLGRWANGSRLVGWLLADPDPDVVVVDLRETYTVGPLLRGLEWAADRVARTADATGVATVGRSLAAHVRSEPARLLGWIIAGLAVPGAAAAALAGDRATLGGWLVLVGVGLLGTRERRSAAELEATRVGAALRAAFEPPEPPEND